MMLKFPLMPPTLVSAALNTVSLELWKQPEIVSEIKHPFNLSPVYPREKYIAWSIIEKRVFDKISYLSLPDSIIDQTHEAIVLLGHRIGIWLEKLLEILPKRNIADYIRLICLNSDGSIDTKNTAASILNAVQSLDIDVRYRFACNNCLQDQVRILWKEFSVQQRERFAYGLHCPIVTFWSYDNMGNLDELKRLLKPNTPKTHNDIYHWCLRESITTSNSVAFRYFWKGLTEEEKRKNSVHYALNSINKSINSNEWYMIEIPVEWTNYSKDICHFLVSQMNEVQLRKMVQQDPYATLNFWFWCEYWENRLISLKSLLNFTSPAVYLKFLHKLFPFPIMHVSLSELFLIKFKIIFKKLWSTTPNNIKRKFFQDVYQRTFTLRSMLYANVEILQLVFDDATAEQRKQIVDLSIWRDFVHCLKCCCHSSLRNVPFMKVMHLSEQEIDVFLQDLDASFKTNEKKDGRWPLLETIQKWKNRNTTLS